MLTPAPVLKHQDQQVTVTSWHSLLTYVYFEPMKPEIERLSRGIKDAFDPAGVLNCGRMYANM